MNILKSLDFMVDYQQFEHDKVSHPEIYDIVVCNNLFKYNNPELFRNLCMIQLVSAGIDESLSDYATSISDLANDAKKLPHHCFSFSNIASHN